MATSQTCPGGQGNLASSNEFNAKIWRFIRRHDGTVTRYVV